MLGEMNEFVSTMSESSVLFPFVSGSSLEMNGTSVKFTCLGDCDLSRQPRSLLQSPRVSPKADQNRGVTWLGQADWRATVVNELPGFDLSQIALMQEGEATSSTDVAKQFQLRQRSVRRESVHDEQEQLLRAAEKDQRVLEGSAKPIPELNAKKSTVIVWA